MQGLCLAMRPQQSNRLRLILRFCSAEGRRKGAEKTKRDGAIYFGIKILTHACMPTCGSRFMKAMCISRLTTERCFTGRSKGWYQRLETPTQICLRLMKRKILSVKFQEAL